jgi:predicted ATPase
MEAERIVDATQIGYVKADLHDLRAPNRSSCPLQRALPGSARHGQQAEASDLLALIYQWFKEGFDTLDLQEAKPLLDELA